MMLHQAREAFSDADLSPPPLLRGTDLQRIGYPRGPMLGRILEALETAQLDGLIQDRESAMGFVKETFPLAIPTTCRKSEGET